MRRNQTIMLAALVLVVSAALDAERCQAAAYIKFDGVDGESKDTGRRGWSDLTGFSLHVVAGGTRTAATMSNRFSMLADQSLPVLLDALVRGTDFSMVEVETTSPDGAEIYQYELTDARLADLAVTHDASGVGRVVGEILAPEVRILHVPTGNEMIWDFSTNSASALAPLAGDYDGDSDVDADDYAKWRDTYGAQMLNLGGGADGNADGRVDAADFTIWRDNYTGSNLFSPTAAPEPAAALLLSIALLAAGQSRRIN